MRKIVATALAAGALAAGGAASAQNLGDVVLNILGAGPANYQVYGTPAVVAGTTYRDTMGRSFYYDQYGRQVYLQQQSPQIAGYDAWGRPVYTAPAVTWGSGYGGYANGGNYAYGSRSWDYDGDGVANHRDRYPQDPRYR